MNDILKALKKSGNLEFYTSENILKKKWRQSGNIGRETKTERLCHWQIYTKGEYKGYSLVIS